MKKSLLWAVILVLSISMIAVSSLAGCKKEAAPAEEATEEEEAAPAEEAAEEEEAAPAEIQKLTIWSHWADEDSKKEFVMEAVRKFKDKNQNFEVEVVWYQKTDLITALTTAFQSHTAPDIFYLDPKATGAFPPFVDYGLMYDLSKYIDQLIDPSTIPFAKEGDMTYLLPLELFTSMIYYNKDIFKEAGVEVPANGRFDMDEFKEAVKKIKAAGFTPFAAGTMDRKWVARYVLEQIILRMAGEEKWMGIAKGTTAWTDPDVIEAVKYVEELVKLGAYSEGVASVKLGESHGLFFGGEYAMFPMGTFFAGRAFVPVEKGGIDPNFPLGIMPYPSVKGGKANDVNYIQVGGSFGVNAFSKNVEKAAELVAIIGSPEMGKMWMETVKVGTGIKVDVASITDPYLKAMNEANKGFEFIPGPIEFTMDATYMDVFDTLTTAFVADLISVDDMMKQLEDARAEVNK